MAVCVCVCTVYFGELLEMAPKLLTCSVLTPYRWAWAELPIIVNSRLQQSYKCLSSSRDKNEKTRKEKDVWVFLDMYYLEKEMKCKVKFFYFYYYFYFINLFTFFFWCESWWEVCKNFQTPWTLPLISNHPYVWSEECSSCRLSWGACHRVKAKMLQLQLIKHRD